MASLEAETTSSPSATSTLRCWSKSRRRRSRTSVLSSAPSPSTSGRPHSWRGGSAGSHAAWSSWWRPSTPRRSCAGCGTTASSPRACSRLPSIACARGWPIRPARLRRDGRSEWSLPLREAAPGSDRPCRATGEASPPMRTTRMRRHASDRVAAQRDPPPRAVPEQGRAASRSGATSRDQDYAEAAAELRPSPRPGAPPRSRPPWCRSRSR